MDETAPFLFPTNQSNLNITLLIDKRYTRKVSLSLPTYFPTGCCERGGDCSLFTRSFGFVGESP